METMFLSLFGTGIGVGLGRFNLVSAKFPRSLGRILYRFGLPLQIFAIAHHVKITEGIWFPPLITILVLLLGLVLASLNLSYGKELGHLGVIKNIAKKLLSLFSDRAQKFNFQIPQHPQGKGSFLLASTLGSTGYLGLSIVPVFVSSVYSGWAVRLFQECVVECSCRYILPQFQKWIFT
jgi:malate permease and related proteins